MLLPLRPLLRPSSAICLSFVLPVGRFWAYEVTGPITRHRKDLPWSDVAPSTRSVMRANKGKNTGPEIAIRRMLHQAGYRFRLHRKDLPGRPDLAFPGRQAAIEVRGCYWHGHGCWLGQPSKTRVNYWGPKIQANRVRDARNLRAMEEAGWRVMEVWECELRRDPAAVLAAVQAFLGPPGGQFSVTVPPRLVGSSA